MQPPVRKLPGAALGVLAVLTGCASDPPAHVRPASAPPSVGGVALAKATTGAVPRGETGIIHQTPPGPEAVRLDANAAVGAVAMLAPLVAALVPEGAAAVGPLVAGQFTAGQSLREPVRFKAGACYTVVAIAAAPITEVDLALTPAVATPGFDPAAAKDPETGLVASIGKKPDCFEWALPAAGFMTLTVPAGQGVAAAQVYEKP